MCLVGSSVVDIHRVHSVVHRVHSVVHRVHSVVHRAKGYLGSVLPPYLTNVTG